MENSIKYHINRKGKLTVFIIISQDNNLLNIELFDSYKEIKTSMIGKGVGLINVKKRVEMANGTFRIQNGSISIVFKAYIVPRKMIF